MGRAVIRRVLVLASLALAVGTQAHAYTGGPDMFEPLGWSAKEQRVYWLVHGRNESGSGPAVYYAELAAGKSRQAVRLEWSRGYLDSVALRRIDGLRRRLVPLCEAASERTVAGSTVVVTETGPGSRRTIRGSFRSGYTFDLVAYCQSDVALIHDYVLPGHREHLVVVAFIGIEYSCEETQEAAVVLPGAAIPRLEYVSRW